MERVENTKQNNKIAGLPLDNHVLLLLPCINILLLLTNDAISYKSKPNNFVFLPSFLPSFLVFCLFVCLFFSNLPCLPPSRFEIALESTNELVIDQNELHTGILYIINLSSPYYPAIINTIIIIIVS